MRQLLAQGKTVSEVARLIGVEYQFAYGVAKRAGYVGSASSTLHELRQPNRASWDDLDIEANLRTYLGSRRPTDRYTSFDYCFNFFQDWRANEGLSLGNGSELQLACLHLGFYLASWGMYRGSTVLLQRSLAHLVPVVEAVTSSPASVWAIDANDYSLETATLVLETAARIRAAFPEGASDTLVTKIMLGVFGSVPAFDTNFRRAFGTAFLSASSLVRIGRFYRNYADIIERYRVPTLDFASGAETGHRYSRAKVIDMIFFIEGGATT
jgi:hypothetical protein